MRQWQVALQRKRTSGLSQVTSLTPLQLTFSRVVITSEAFITKLQAARHRMVYNILKEEMAQDGGIHALQLKTLTPEDAGFTQEKGEPALGVKGAGAANAYTA